MIDTISATLYLNWQHLQNIQKLLESMQSGHDNFETGGRSYTGGLRNMSIKVSENCIKVDGSLSKFHLGNNVQSLTGNTTKRAIEELSDLLSLPMKEAQLNRLDTAQNLSVMHPPTSYFDYFGECKYMQRLEQGNGLYYRNTLGVRVLYDKSKDLEKFKINHLDLISLLNLLRIEVRQFGHKNICKRYEVQEMTLGELCKPVVYRGLINVWGKEYDKIEKYEDVPLFDEEVYRNPSKFCAQITYNGILAMGGQNAIMSLVKQAKARNVFSTPQQYSALRRKIRNLGKLDDKRIENPMLAEITNKVMDIVKYAV